MCARVCLIHWSYLDKGALMRLLVAPPLNTVAPPAASSTHPHHHSSSGASKCHALLFYMSVLDVWGSLEPFLHGLRLNTIAVNILFACTTFHMTHPCNLCLKNQTVWGTGCQAQRWPGHPLRRPGLLPYASPDAQLLVCQPSQSARSTCSSISCIPSWLFHLKPQCLHQCQPQPQGRSGGAGGLRHMAGQSGTRK